MKKSHQRKSNLMLNLDKNKRYLLACSYGPDSMALFKMLLDEKYDFEVAHVNYHLRSESNSEQEGLKSFCNIHKIKLHIYEVNEDLGHSNIEAKCRNIRYEFFKKLNAEFSFDATLIAHNQDDLIETYILQKRRKNLVKFYGIAENCCLFDMEIIRPLLNYKKSELTSFCIKNNVPYSIDKTNLENTFERNKIRHLIIELMNDEERDNYIKEINLENSKLKTIFDNISSLDLSNKNILLKLDDIELAYSLNLLLEKSSLNYQISFQFVKEIKKALLSDKSNIFIPIKSNLYFVKEYNACKFIEMCSIEYSYILDKPGELDTPYFYLNFTKDSSNRNVTINDYPITIRNARSGDMYLIKGYQKQVRRLFIDWKLPVTKRSTWPVIISNSGKIIYIPRYQKDFKPTKDCNLIVK